MSAIFFPEQWEKTCGRKKECVAQYCRVQREISARKLKGTDITANKTKNSPQSIVARHRDMQFLIGSAVVWPAVYILDFPSQQSNACPRISCRRQRFDFLRGTDKSGREISLLRIVREPSWIPTIELEQSVVPVPVMYLIQALFVLRKFDPEIDCTLQT